MFCGEDFTLNQHFKVYGFLCPFAPQSQALISGFLTCLVVLFAGSFHLCFTDVESKVIVGGLSL